jgi:hypothetical protein
LALILIRRPLSSVGEGEVTSVEVVGVEVIVMGVVTVAGVSANDGVFRVSVV